MRGGIHVSDLGEISCPILGNMAIKRDTREFEVSVPAELFARSFAECMADPGRWLPEQLSFRRHRAL
ncbi:MAG: hypothetical protein SFV15_11430 [Polyangiaceae bacterium]|nr:hypothetical protein [Polyangiaceae bacterium]